MELCWQNTAMRSQVIGNNTLNSFIFFNIYIPKSIYATGTYTILCKGEMPGKEEKKMISINGRNVNLFDSMFDYINDADLTRYVISDGKVREAPFVEPIKPLEDSDFMVWIDDKITYEGDTYVKVNFGEDDSEEYGESILLESALDEEVYMIFTEKETGIPVYVPESGYIYEIRETAEQNLD